MKKYLGIALALCFTISAASATSDFGTAFKNAIKSDVQAVKEAAKKDVKNQQEASKKERQAQLKEKKQAIIDKRDTQLKPVQEQIKQKEQQIKDTKKDSSLTETQKTIRIRAYQRQLDSLNSKKDSINKLYNAQLKALN